MAVDMEEAHEQTTRPIGPPRRKHHNLLIAGGVVTLIIGGAIGAGIAAGGCDAQHAVVNAPAATQPAPNTPTTPAPTQPTGPTTLATSQTATITQYGKTIGTITVNSVNVTTSAPAPSYAPPGVPPYTPANGYFVVANITVTSTSNSFPYNALYFYGLDANGTHYSNGNGNAINALPGPGSMFGSGELNAGENATGQVAFDMATPSGHIVYQPMLFGTNGPVAQWAFGS